MTSVVEIGDDDLYGLIAALTHSGWQPSGGRYRINVVHRGLEDAEQSLDTGLVRLAGDSSREIEPHILRNFRKYAARDAVVQDSDWNWLSVAQHHGLPTRLLDWTHFPYVALHFATRDPSSYDRPGAVWCVDYAAAHELLPPALREEITAQGAGLFTTEMLSSIALTLADFDGHRDAEGHGVPLFFEPPSLDERIINQSAVFSALSDPTASLGDWLEPHPQLVRTVVFPAALKWRIRDHLDQATMNERILFPGLDGLALWLTRYYGPRPDPAPGSPSAAPGMGGQPG